jgi:phenylacetic acid degradation operon negative regulatory protein
LTGFLINSNISFPMNLTPKSLILDLLSTLGGRSMPVRALVDAAALFAIEENSLRVALTRLLAARTVERDERGEYRLGKNAHAVQHQVVSWRHIEERLRPWRGGWVGLSTAGSARGARSELRHRERALRFFGFRELTDGRARELWDARTLVADYRRSSAELAASEARLPALSARAAMVESFLLGGRVIRQLVLDPLLPEPIVDAAERRALATAMRRYDKLGHACWRAFFADYRLTSLRAPVDSNIHQDSETRLSA